MLNKGTFKSYQSLQQTYPIGKEGWIAMIGINTYIWDIFSLRWKIYNIDEYNNIYNEINNTNLRIDNITNCITTTIDLLLNETNHKIVCDATNNNITITLPTAVGINGEQFIITRIDNSINTVTIQPQVGETIYGDTSEVLNQYETLDFYSDNTNYN